MAVRDETIAWVKDTLGRLGHITVRRMFGGAGAYCDGLIFAILDDDTIYLKVDDTTRQAFEAEGCGPFIYVTGDGTRHTMAAYHKAPERLLDDTDAMITWVRAAIDVSRRAARAKAAKPAAQKKKRRTGPVRRS
jgi:DNA transformation protein